MNYTHVKRKEKRLIKAPITEHTPEPLERDRDPLGRRYGWLGLVGLAAAAWYSFTSDDSIDSTDVLSQSREDTDWTETSLE